MQVGEKFDKEILISKYNDKLYATGNACPHFALPFSYGDLLFNNKLMCPFHGAAFDIETGKVECGPTIDSIPTYKIEEQLGKFFVHYDLNIPDKMIGELAKRNK